MPQHVGSRHRPSRHQPSRHEPGAAGAGPAAGVLTWPVTIPPDTAEYEILGTDEIFRSPLTPSIQVSELEGEFWIVDWTFRNLQDDRGEVAAFISRLKGASGRAIIPVVDAPQTGVLTGAPLVNGASQTGLSIATTGWTASVTGIIKAGDYFNLNGELKICTEDADSDGSGLSTINFEPFIRFSPGDLSAIEVADPTIQVILISRPGWKTEPGMVSNHAHRWIEDVYKDLV